MDGTTVRGWVAMPLSPSGAWQIAGVADLSGDGRPDVVWQNRATRENGIWEMGGSLAGVLAWYPFDEAAGDVAADFANAAPRSDLQLVGAAHVAGKVGGGIGVGPGAYATGGADKNVGTGDFSIAFWIRLDPIQSAYVMILDKRVENPYRGYHMLVENGEPLIQLADGGAYGGWYNYYSGIAGGALRDGEWHFLAVTVQRASSQGIRWYLDGAPAGQVGDPTPRQGSLSNDAPLLVGRHAFHGEGSPAALDELQIFDHALTPGEVSVLLERHLYR